MKFTAVLFATVLRVIDGDTFVVNVNNCDFDIFCKNLDIRVAHIDTPELKSTCPNGKEKALQAKSMTESILKPGSDVVILSPKRDNYFRIVGDVEQIRKPLIEKGLAVPYEGGKKTFDWCK